MGTQLGRSQPRAGLVGKHSRDRTSLSQTSYLAIMRGKGKQESKLLSRYVTPQSKRFLPPCLENQAWSLGVIHHANNRKRTVNMQSWRTAQKPVRPRSTTRSRQTTNCGKFSRTCHRNTGHISTVTVSSRKWNRWMMRSCLAGSQKAIPTLAKSDRKTEKPSGASLGRDRIETQETSGNPAKMDRG